MSKINRSNLAIFASGTGSNADKICSYFKNHSTIKINLIVSNRVNAGVLDVASSHGIDSVAIPKSQWDDQENILPVLKSKGITHIVLAGFLLLLPSWIVKEFSGHIINIHPALLPKYGGKGMFGMNVHQKVKEEGDDVSGITIHEVDENYDEGEIIFQERVEIDREDSATDIAYKVLKLEHYYYPIVIERWVHAKG